MNDYMNIEKIFFIENTLINIPEELLQKTYIIDSNIAVKLRNLFYNPSKIDNVDFERYMSLLKFFKNKDVLPGIAIQETCWDFEKNELNDNKLRRMEYALNNLWEYDDQVYKRINRREGFTYYDYPLISIGKKNLNGLYENKYGNVLIMGTVCLLFKFYKLLETESSKERIYNDIVDFLNDELKINLAYELSCITYLLFPANKENGEEAINIRHLLKLSGKDKKKSLKENVWNASWDIFYLRILNEAASNFLNGEELMDQVYNPVLVTEDKNLNKLASYLLKPYVSGYDFDDKHIRPGIEINFSIIDEKYINLVEEKFNMLEENAQNRKEFFEKKRSN